MSLQDLIKWHESNGVELNIDHQTSADYAKQHLVDNQEVPQLLARRKITIANSLNDLEIVISIHDYETYCNTFPKNRTLDIEFNEHIVECVTRTFRDGYIYKPNNYNDLVKYFLIMKRLKVDGF